LKHYLFVHGLDLAQMVPKRRDRAGWQHGHPILRTFAVAHQNFPPLEVHILDP
jgi:hypothetical protein